MLINAYLLICLFDCIFVYCFVNRQGIVLSATRNAIDILHYLKINFQFLKALFFCKCPSVHNSHNDSNFIMLASYIISFLLALGNSYIYN